MFYDRQWLPPSQHHALPFLRLSQVSGAFINIRCPMYARDEQALRNRIRGTVWQPGALRSFPGILSAHKLTIDMRDQLSEFSIPGEVWNRTQSRLDKIDIHSLQGFFMFAISRGCDPLSLGPFWEDQHKAYNAAAFGTQRAASLSSRSLDPMIPPGLGKLPHMQAACELNAPFQLSPLIDMDTLYAAQEMAVFDIK